MVTCAICGCEGKVLTKHIKKIHGMSRKEYEKRFPDSPVVCPESHENGVRVSQYMHTDEAKKSASDGRKEYWGNLSDEELALRVEGMVEYKRSDEGRLEQSERMKKLSPEYWKSEDYRRRVSSGISESMKEHWSDPEYYDRMCKIFSSTPHELSDDVIEIRRHNMRQLNERIYSDPEYRQSVCSPLWGKGENAGDRGGVRVHYISKKGTEVVFRSLWELKVAIALDDLSIEWEYEPFRLDSPSINYIPDFLIGNIILEVKPSVFIDEYSESKKDLAVSKGYRFEYIDERYIPNILNTDLDYVDGKVIYRYTVQRLSKYESIIDLLSRVGIK